MKGYRKIHDGSITVNILDTIHDDNYTMDEDIRSQVHSPILGHVEKTKGRSNEFVVVIYAKKV
jgi:hypothetical protein